MLRPATYPENTLLLLVVCTSTSISWRFTRLSASNRPELTSRTSAPASILLNNDSWSYRTNILYYSGLAYRVRELLAFIYREPLLFCLLINSNSFSRPFLLSRQEERNNLMEPCIWLEQITYALQVRCSTIELTRQMVSITHLYFYQKKFLFVNDN